MDSAISLKEDATLDKTLSAFLDAREARQAELGRSVSMGFEEVVQRAESIYNARYRAKFEQFHSGQFVALDLESEQAYLGDTPREALLKILEASLTATFFVFKVGSDTVFDVTPGGWSVGRKWFL
jgi:hypothetical protein